MSETLERVSALGLERGLYILRYVSTAASLAPVIFVRPSPGYENVVVFLSSPGDEANFLSQPLSFIIVRASEAARIQVTVRACEGGNSCEAELKLEPLTDRRVNDIFELQRSLPSRQKTVEQAERPSADTSKFTLLAHVAMLGDVSAAPLNEVRGETLAQALTGGAVRHALECAELGI